MRGRLVRVWRELRQRHVIQVVVAYLVLAAAIGGAASDFLPGLGAPAWALSTVLALLVLGVPIAAATAWVFELTPDGIRATPSRKNALGTTPSVAVLAFADMSPDADQEFFADGLSEEIINALAQVNGLRVVGRTSAFAFKGKAEDLRTVGEKLDVSAILEGSVRRAGEQLRVTAKLVDATTGYHLFSESYDRRFGDVFEIQDEIAREVTRRLCDTLPDRTVNAEAARPHARDVTAYEAYLRGMFFYWQYSSEAASRALKCFEDALQRDPDYALAHAGASIAHTWLAGFGHELTTSTPERAMESAKRALELDPTLPEGLNSLAEAKFWLDWDFEGATEAVRQAIELSPSSTFARVLYSFCLRVGGRFDDAVTQLEKAIELDPLSVPIHNELGNAYLAAGRKEDAEVQMARTLGLDSEFAPTLETRGWLAVQEGELELALEIFEALPRGRPSTMAALGFTLARLGRTDAAREMLAELQRSSRTRRISTGVDIARIYAGLGELDEATRHLERAVESKAIPAILLSSSIRQWGQFAHDPRFQRLADRRRHRGGQVTHATSHNA